MLEQYKKGRRKEYRVVDKLKKLGFEIVVRSAGSHSPIDVWAVDVEGRNMRLIQVKSGKPLGESVKKKLLNKMDRISGYYHVSCELWD